MKACGTTWVINKQWADTMNKSYVWNLLKFTSSLKKNPPKL